LPNDVKIKKLEIDLGDGEGITLSMEKAKRLFKALNELFGSENSPVYIPYPVASPYRHYDHWWERPKIMPRWRAEDNILLTKTIAGAKFNLNPSDGLLKCSL
jgi:hypothetical protein